MSPLEIWKETSPPSFQPRTPCTNTSSASTVDLVKMHTIDVATPQRLWALLQHLSSQSCLVQKCSCRYGGYCHFHGFHTKIVGKPLLWKPAGLASLEGKESRQ